MEIDWSLVYPELKGSGADPTKKSKSVTEQLDDMLGKSKVGTELIDSLGKGMTNLSDTVGKMSKLGDASVATQEFSTNVKTAAGSVSAFNNITVEAGGKISEMTKAYGGVANSIATLNAAAADAEVYKAELSKLTSNLKNLNSIYGGMLSAMTGNK
jgi:methyl-accepting chemotaxis protein